MAEGSIKRNFLHDWAQNWAKERPRQYVMIWVTFWNIMSYANTALSYGWNVWVDDLFAAFYGNQERTFARGGPVFAFSLVGFCWQNSLFFMGIVIGITRAKERFGLSARSFYIIGLVISTLGIALMGVGVQYTQLWLLFIGASLYGFFAGLMQPVSKFVVILAFYNIGQKSVGQGINSAIPGLWAASFSYWAPAITDATSIQVCIYISAGIAAVLSLIPIPFTEVQVPNLSKYHKRSKERMLKEQEAAEEAGDATGPVAEPVKLPIGIILAQPQIWLMWFCFLFLMTPGFGMKYLISPMLESVYDASESTQSTASFLFLFLYSVARFLGGALDYYFDVVVEHQNSQRKIKASASRFEMFLQATFFSREYHIFLLTVTIFCLRYFYALLPSVPSWC
jgi:hypothetical protein